MGKSVYVGFQVTSTIPMVHDPHITLAFIEVPEEDQNPRHNTDTFSLVRSLAWKLWKALEGKKFTVKYLDMAHFGENGEVPVILVTLPDQVLEHAEHFRTALYLSEVVYSNRFPFQPHITIQPETLEFAPVAEFEVTGVFVDNGDERKTLHLK